MAAASVSALLPRPFADLTLADVSRIITDVGEPRETLFFERKASVQPATLAKSCAAFANTYGGLLVVGVSDGSDSLEGINLGAEEAQVWVKDCLRGHVLPVPPFNARWLSTDSAGGLGLLLVLVAESSTTPHLMTRTGVIYVRNPGSSDPVPIRDQARLLDLTARGRESRERAFERADELGALFAPHHSFGLGTQTTETVILVPTGVSPDFEVRLFEDPALGPLHALMEELGHLNPTAPMYAPQARWEQHAATVTRDLNGHPRTLHAVKVDREGPVIVHLGDTEDSGRTINGDDALRRFELMLGGGRELLKELGAHGEVRLVYVVNQHPRYLNYRTEQTPRAITIREWTALDEADDPRLLERITREFGRAMGLPPETAVGSG